MTLVQHKKPRLGAARKPLVLNLFTQPCVNSQPSGLWTYPGDVSKNYNTLKFWTDLAQKAEKAKLNAIFIADVLGPYDVYNGPGNHSYVSKAATQFPGIDPAIPISAMAAVTKSLGFGITFSTISEHPYLFARKLATLDFMTEGRVGWNIVSSYLDSAARNLLNGDELPEKLDRYAKTDEYVQVVAELLLSSFRVDAVKSDLLSKTYADPALIRKIDFKGKWYEVPGPSYTSPSPQGIPLIIQAGASPGGVELCAKWAEVTFTYGITPESLGARMLELKTLAAEKYERRAGSIRVLVFVMVIVAETEDEAWSKFDRYASYTDHEAALAMIGGWTNVDLSIYDDEFDLMKSTDFKVQEVLKRFCAQLISKGVKLTRKEVARHVSVKGSADLVIGSVDQVVQRLVDYVEIGGADGFNFASAVNPDTFDDLIEQVIPRLKERGLVWDDYSVPGGTLRENVYGAEGQVFLPVDHPAHAYRWKQGDEQYFGLQLSAYKKSLLAKQGNPWYQLI